MMPDATQRVASMHADKVIKHGKLAGVSTSRGYSYYFREMLSLCKLDAACCEPGREVIVVGGIRTARKKKSAPRLRQRPTRPTTASSTFIARRRQSSLAQFRRRRKLNEQTEETGRNTC